MMSALLVAGTVAVLAGLGAIAYGIPVKEFSFGNTMVLSGTIAVCTGLLLFGLSAVLGELKVMTHRLRLRLSTDEDPKALQLPGRDRERDEVDVTAAPPIEDLWREGGSPRGRSSRALERPLLPEPEPEPEPEPVIPIPEPKPRRNLFEARRERERTEKRAAEPVMPDFRTPPMSEPPPLPMDEPALQASPPDFEESWPKQERMRAPEPILPPLPPLQRRAARAAPAFMEPPPPRPAESPAVAVIKSGVVDGMAYSLYSDGSIEAQMPEGMMRFASIDELRTHLDQRR